MVTATSSRDERRVRRVSPRLAAAALAAFLIPFAAVAALHDSHPSRPAAPAAPAAFAWVRPAAPPPGWRVAATPSGSRLAYPPGWRQIESDVGTVSAAPSGSHGAFRGFLNATPQGGSETLANWSRFRPAHVADEGAHAVRLEASATGLRFGSGRASVVIDSYSTGRSRFREIAAIVTGTRGTTVVVAAAPVTRWSRLAPVLERAVATFST
jgi:hypothetical protein